MIQQQLNLIFIVYFWCGNGDAGKFFVFGVKHDVYFTPATAVEVIGFDFELYDARAAITTATSTIGMEMRCTGNVALLQQKHRNVYTV